DLRRVAPQEAGGAAAQRLCLVARAAAHAPGRGRPDGREQEDGEEDAERTEEEVLPPEEVLGNHRDGHRPAEDPGQLAVAGAGVERAGAAVSGGDQLRLPLRLGCASRLRYRRHSVTRSTARNASCGISICPTAFMRFLPSFCFSRSLRLREMSPP